MSYNKYHTITMSDYGAPPSQFGVVTPSRAQVAQQREAESYREAAARHMRIMQEAKQYQLNKFNDRFPPRKLSRTRSRPSSRTRSRSNKSRKRSRHSV